MEPPPPALAKNKKSARAARGTRAKANACARIVKNNRNKVHRNERGKLEALFPDDKLVILRSWTICRGQLERGEEKDLERRGVGRQARAERREYPQ